MWLSVKLDPYPCIFMQARAWDNFADTSRIEGAINTKDNNKGQIKNNTYTRERPKLTRCASRWPGVKWF